MFIYTMKQMYNSSFKALFFLYSRIKDFKENISLYNT